MVKRNYGFPDEWASTFLLLLRARTASLQYRFCRLFFVHSSALRVLTLPFLGITIKIVTHLGYRQQRVFSLKSPRQDDHISAQCCPFSRLAILVIRPFSSYFS